LRKTQRKCVMDKRETPSNY